jgi:hypothetical protein
VSFEDLFARPEPEDDEESEEQATPPWWGPSPAELGICVPQNVLLAQSDRAYVGITHVFAYSAGVQLEFVAFGRGVKQAEVHSLFHGMHRLGGEEAPDTFLRLGVELADGTRASNLGGWRHSLDEQPDAPVFHPHGGGGGSSGGRTFSTRPGYWLWPLPPSGPLRIWCEWPALDIPLSSAELDASALVAAAERSEQIWD